MSKHAKRGMYVRVESIRVGDYIRVLKEPCEVVEVEALEGITRITYAIRPRITVTRDIHNGLTMFTYRRKA